jgi:hypothetical protein
MATVKRAQAGAVVKDKQATDMFNAAGKIKKATVKKLPSDINKAFPKAKDGMWMQKAAASIKKRGTEGKCTPITKPGCTGKAKVLAKTFKKIAKSNKKK